MKKILTGVKPTGVSMHLGNLVGALLPLKRILAGNDTAIFIADLHALTSVKDGEKLREQSLEVAIEYLSIFGDESIIYCQSDIRDITKLMWILANVTPYSLMLRAHSFKDAEAKNADINMGVFNYPILMAADIIGYDIDAVPVGRDQLQHLEMTRDIARSFNKTYGQDVFKEPEAITSDEFDVLPGIDGRKMSKSYDNFIGIFDDENLLKKRVMSIVTDSRGVDEKKDPDTCNIFALVKAFGTKEEEEILHGKYLQENSGFGYGHAKLYLLDILTRYTAPYRERREKFLQNPEYIEEKLRAGAEIMNARLEEKMRVVRELTGIR